MPRPRPTGSAWRRRSWTRCRARFAGQRLERQELDGLLLDDIEGALWSSETLEAARLRGDPPAFDRVVVAVDPSVSGGVGADECGIVVVGASMQGPPADWRAVVLEDVSLRASSPTVWAEAAVRAWARHGADRIVAEVNQGGDMVKTVLRTVNPLVPCRSVRATVGKAGRAVPVAALYEQGRVAHRRGLAALEAQMCAMTAEGYLGRGSPDRMDALVWALTDLMVEPAARHWAGQARIRTL